MFSEALAILDRNTEKYMIEEMKEELNEIKQEIGEAKQELGETKQELSKTKQALEEKENSIMRYRAKLEQLGIDPDEIE